LNNEEKQVSRKGAKAQRKTPRKHESYVIAQPPLLLLCAFAPLRENSFILNINFLPRCPLRSIIV
jgi:hypothetical protein